MQDKTITTTPDEMLGWLDTEMGIAQTLVVRTGNDAPFYRLKAIYDFINQHKDCHFDQEIDFLKVQLGAELQWKRDNDND